MRTVLEERVRPDERIDRLERIEYKRQPHCTSGKSRYASDCATVHVVEWEVSIGLWDTNNPNISPIHLRHPSLGANRKRFKTLSAARKAFNEGKVTLIYGERWGESNRAGVKSTASGVTWKGNRAQGRYTEAEISKGRTGWLYEIRCNFGKHAFLDADGTILKSDAKAVVEAELAKWDREIDMQGGPSKWR